MQSYRHIAFEVPYQIPFFLILVSIRLFNILYTYKDDLFNKYYTLTASFFYRQIYSTLICLLCSVCRFIFDFAKVYYTNICPYTI